MKKFQFFADGKITFWVGIFSHNRIVRLSPASRLRNLLLMHALIIVILKVVCKSNIDDVEQLRDWRQLIMRNHGHTRSVDKSVFQQV